MSEYQQGQVVLAPPKPDHDQFEAMDVRAAKKAERLLRYYAHMMQVDPENQKMWAERAQAVIEQRHAETGASGAMLEAEAAADPERQAAKRRLQYQDEVKRVTEEQGMAEHLGRQFLKRTFDLGNDLGRGFVRWLTVPFDVDFDALEKKIPGWKLNAAVEKVFEGPEWQPVPAKNLDEVLKNPKALFGRLVGATPYMVAMIGIGQGVGSLGAFAMSYFVEFENAYQDAKDYGAPDDKAELAAGLIAPIVAAIEFVQMRQVVSLTEGGRELLKRRALKQAFKNLTRYGPKAVFSKGRTVAMRVLRTAAHEAIEEQLQGIVSEELAEWTYGKPVEKGWLDRRLQEGVLGGLLALGTAGLLKGGQITIEQAQKIQQRFQEGIEKRSGIMGRGRAAEAGFAALGPAGEGGEAKQAWEMTASEWADAVNIGGTAREQREARKASGVNHRRYVTRALREGKPVPVAVLADYPDLAPAAPAEAAEKPAPVEAAPAAEPPAEAAAGEPPPPGTIKALMQSPEHAPRKIIEAYRAGRADLAVAHKALATVVRRDLPKSKQGDYLNRIASATNDTQLSRVAQDITDMSRRYAVAKATSGETEIITTNIKVIEDMGRKFREGVRKGTVKGARDVVENRKYLLALAKQAGVPSWAIGKLAPHLTVKTTKPIPGKKSQLQRAVESVFKIAEASKKRDQLADYYKLRSKLSIDDLPPGVQDEAHALLSGITDKTSIRKAADTLARLENVLVQAYAREKVDVPNSIADAFKKATAEMEKQSVHEMTSDELFTLNEAVRAIIHQAKHIKLAWDGEKWAVRKELKSGIIERLQERFGGKRAVPQGMEGDLRRLAYLLKFEGMDRLSYDVTLSMMLGEGAEYHALYDGLQRGERARQRIEVDAADATEALLKRHKLSGKMAYSRMFGRLSRKITVEASTGEKLVAHPRSIIWLLMQLQDSDTGPKIVTGQNPVFLPNATQPTEFSSRFWLELPSIVPEKLRALADDWVKLWNGDIVRVANEASVRVRGHRIAKPGSTYVARVAVSEKDVAPDDLLPQNTIGEPSYMHPRREHGQPIRVVNPMEMWKRHIQAVGNYAGKYEAARTARDMLLNDSAVKQAMRESLKYADDWRGNLEDDLNAYYSRELVRPGTGVRFFQKIIRNIHRVVLAPVHISVYQPVSWAFAAGENPALTRPGVFAKAVAMLANPKEVARMARKFHDESPVMFGRINATAHEIMTAGAGAAKTEAWARGKQPLRDLILWPIHFMDSRAIFLIHFGLEAAGYKGEAFVREGERLVERTQPTWDALTVSNRTLQKRKSVIVSLMDMFNSQRSKNFNMFMREFFRASRGFAMGDSRAGMRGILGMVRVGTMSFLTALIIAHIRRAARRWERGELPVIEDVEGERWMNKIAAAAKVVAQNVTGTGDLAVQAWEAIRAGQEGKWWTPDRPNVLVSLVNTTIRGFKRVGEATGKDANKRFKSGKHKGMRRRDVAMLEAVRDLTSAAGQFTGIPIEPLWRYSQRFLPTKRKQTWGGAGGIKSELKRRGLTLHQMRPYYAEHLRRKGRPEEAKRQMELYNKGK